MSGSEDSRDGVQVTTRRSSRISAAESKFSCAVNACSSVNGTLKDEKPILFFDPPSAGKQQSSTRAAWFKAVPALSSTTGSNKKVCELHFVDGRPTTENPVPTLLLNSPRKRTHDEANEDAPLFDNGRKAPKEEPVSPPKKMSTVPSAGLKWRTSAGTPKQLAFNKVGDKKVIRVVAANGAVRKLANGTTVVQRATTSVPSPSQNKPNLATMLANVGLSLDTSPSTSTAVNVRPSLSSTTPIAPRRSVAIPSTSRSDHHACRITDPLCPNCIHALPQLRRSLGRLEARMDAVASMVKQLVSKHPQTIANTIKIPQPARPLLNGSRPPYKPMVNASHLSTLSVLRPGTKPQLTASKDVRLLPNSFMHNMVSKGLLLYRASCFTVEEYMKNAPNAVKAFSQTQIAHVIGQLIKDGLIKKVDESVSLTDGDCIFEKETDVSRLANLARYGVTQQDFLAGVHDL